MTLAVPTNGDVERYAGGYAGIGLDDVDSSDMAMPRLRILGPEALFEDTLTGEKFQSFDAVVLVLVKQRIMWYQTKHDDAQPQCKSNDQKSGFPNVEAKLAYDEFPWSESNFSPESMVVNKENNMQSLSCKDCKFTEWTKDIAGKSVKPRCNELHTYPLLRLDGEGGYSPALLTVKSSSIKPSKAFATLFKVKNEPFFFYKSRLSLVPAISGSVNYAVVKFQKLDGTDSDDYAGYADQATSLYEYLTKPPRNRNGDIDEPTEMSANVNAPVVEQPVTVVSAPAVVVPPVTVPVAVPAPIATSEVLPPPVAKKSDLPF